ncbi:LPP20 family lipoprotein [candidate division KSB1 bacterium]|nr:LPP20 family lipoprotein [candidate division KSB1 bacterium]
MKGSCIIAPLLSLLLLFAFTAQAQFVNQQVGNGTVDWTNQVVRATGIGSPNPNMPMAAARAGALRAAKLDAMRNLLEAVKGVNLTSETTVRNSMTENDVIVTRVEGIVRNFNQVGQPRYMSTGDVEVTVELTLTGDLLNALLPSDFGGGAYAASVQYVCPTCGQPWPSGKPLPPGVQLQSMPGTSAVASSGVFTGLIVDARGSGLRPAMAPRILDQNGNEVYGSKFVSREWAVKIGMVGYEKDINRARTNDRVTNNPLIVKAIQASGPNQADVVVSAADAASIHAASANMKFLDQCKVMFIVN